MPHLATLIRVLVWTFVGVQVERALAIPPSMQKLMHKGRAFEKNDTDTLEKVRQPAATPPPSTSPSHGRLESVNMSCGQQYKASMPALQLLLDVYACG